MFKRKINLMRHPKESFFLWGPRQSGKSTLLKHTFKEAYYIDLLKSEEFIAYSREPELLRRELNARPECRRVVIDEIQKVPKLLDEVHWLIENKGITFSLCGSSARKLKQGQANLLGGRALRYELFGLTSAEIGSEFELNRMLNNGYLPSYYQLDEAVKEFQRSYVSDYLKEEIAAEGIVRNLPAFSDFLYAASFSDAEILNYSNIALDCGVSSRTVKEYFQILVDTLLGRIVPAYKKRPKRRVIQASKFYFSDVGVVNYLAKRGRLESGSELFGKAFENFICHELHAHSSYSDQHYEISYWQLTSGIEVDFILGQMDVAIEVKSSKKINNKHLKSLRELFIEYPKVKRRILVCLEEKKSKTEDGIEILPYKDFLELLWKNEVHELF